MPVLPWSRRRGWGAGGASTRLKPSPSDPAGKIPPAPPRRLPVHTRKFIASPRGACLALFPLPSVGWCGQTRQRAPRRRRTAPSGASLLEPFSTSACPRAPARASPTPPGPPCAGPTRAGPRQAGMGWRGGAESIPGGALVTFRPMPVTAAPAGGPRGLSPAELRGRLGRSARSAIRRRA